MDLVVRHVNSGSSGVTKVNSVAVGGVEGNSESWCELGLRWPGEPGSQEDADMREDIRGSRRFAWDLCNCVDTPVESVKWLVGWLGLREPWELWYMAQASVIGNAPVAQWLMTTFNLVEVLSVSESTVRNLAEACARGRYPALLKWWIESFPFPQGVDIIFADLVCNKHSTVELCEWVRGHLDIAGEAVGGFLENLSYNPHCLKWATEAFSLSPTESWLNSLCEKTGNAEVIKWMVTEKSIAPTRKTFLAACGSRNQNLELVQWLSTRVILSPEHVLDSLQRALSRNNADIADWIDSTFKATNALISTPDRLSTTFLNVCHRTTKGVDGVKWLMLHIDISQVPVAWVEKKLIGIWSMQVLFMLIKAFNISLQTNLKLRRHVLSVVLSNGTIYDVRQLQSITVLTVEDVAEFIYQGRYLTVSTSKTAKWLVTHVGLEVLKQRGLPFKLLEDVLYRDNAQCTMWLIDTLDIQIEPILQSLHPHCPSMALRTWKQLVSRCPSMNAETIRAKCGKFITDTPFIAEWSMARFSLCPADIKLCCDELESALAPPMSLWVQQKC
ncbi:hypothetical protein Pelo_1161 [Pelomyxa schiedti]|nr:hypothetical protein Pelo_1161 [Pelomyxa schiedti]